MNDIKKSLKEQGIRPKKALGQNFLINKGVLGQVLKAANINGKDMVLEIGPGAGILTLELARAAKKVIAIEKDGQMAEILKNSLNGIKNVEIIKGDVLKIKEEDLKIKESFKLVANLPYYITSPIIRKFLECKNQPQEMVLMVQKEVGQRITAKPPKMSLLAISVQFYAKAEIISYVSKKCFWPVPKVDSALIKITPLQKRNDLPDFDEKFFEVVRAGFSQPRKQLGNNLKNKLKLDKETLEKLLIKTNVRTQSRAESLNLSDWLEITNFLYNENPKK